MPIIPNPRVTMFFDDGVSGWSETHYDLSAVDLKGAINNARTGLVPLRQLLLADGPIIKYVRASYDYVYRDSQVLFVAPPANKNSFGQYINNPAFSPVPGQPTPASWDFGAALCRGINGDLYRSLFYLSGIPYGDMEDISSILDDWVFNSAFINYHNLLCGQQQYANYRYGFAVWQRDGVGFPVVPIQTWASNTLPGPVTVYGVLTNGGAGVPVGYPVPGQAPWRYSLQNMRFLNGTAINVRLNGSYGILGVVQPNQVFLAGFPNTAGLTFISGFGQAQQRGVVQYQDVLLERVTHRKRGRPFDAPRGRSRTRIRRGVY